MDSFRWTDSAEYLTEYSDGQLQMDRFSGMSKQVLRCEASDGQLEMGSFSCTLK